MGSSRINFHALARHGCFNRVGGENGQCSTKRCRMQEEVDMLTKECILSIRHKTNASPRCCEQLVRASYAQCVCPKATLTESIILEF